MCCAKSGSNWPIEIFYLLDNLDASKSCGPDGIPTRLYKSCAHLLAEPLCHIFNYSIESTIFPDAFKLGFVTPIPKCQNATINDLRPITLLPVPSKILEKLVLNSLKPCLLNLYVDDQFGFHPKSSTATALISLHDKVTRLLDQDNVDAVQIISYDFERAFDKLGHHIVLQSLIDGMLPKTFILWIESYLSNRLQQTKIGCATSEVTKVPSGVPQGSVLGPVLFAVALGSLQIDDNASMLSKFADDTNCVFPLYKNQANEHVQESHSQILQWSEMSLNNKKLKTLIISKKIVLHLEFISQIVPLSMS